MLYRLIYILENQSQKYKMKEADVVTVHHQLTNLSNTKLSAPAILIINKNNISAFESVIKAINFSKFSDDSDSMEAMFNQFYMALSQYHKKVQNYQYGKINGKPIPYGMEVDFILNRTHDDNEGAGDGVDYVVESIFQGYDNLNTSYLDSGGGCDNLKLEMLDTVEWKEYVESSGRVKVRLGSKEYLFYTLSTIKGRLRNLMFLRYLSDTALVDSENHDLLTEFIVMLESNCVRGLDSDRNPTETYKVPLPLLDTFVMYLEEFITLSKQKQDTLIDIELNELLKKVKCYIDGSVSD